MTNDRPEWVECIAYPTDDRKTWCGGHYRPFFTDIDHAALNALKQGRLVACPECVNAIHKILTNEVNP